jgi:hypothetical protein
MFHCNICNYYTDVKCNYTKHHTTKKHIKNVEKYKLTSVQNYNFEKMSQNEPKMSQNEPKICKKSHQKINVTFNCSFCNKPFSSKAIMRRHEIHRCKNNLANQQYKSDILMMQKNKEHDKEKKQLYKQIEQLLEKVGDTYNNNTFNTTNNIVLNNYGNEDFSHITNHILNKLLETPIKMIGELTKMIHFNDNKPENMNIYIPNKKDKYIKVYKNGQWILEDKNERIPDIVDRNFTILDTHYDQIENTLPEWHKKIYKSLQEKYDTKDTDVLNNQKKIVELEILNGTTKVLGNKKNI